MPLAVTLEAGKNGFIVDRRGEFFLAQSACEMEEVRERDLFLLELELDAMLLFFSGLGVYVFSAAGDKCLGDQLVFPCCCCCCFCPPVFCAARETSTSTAKALVGFGVTSFNICLATFVPAGDLVSGVDGADGADGMDGPAAVDAGVGAALVLFAALADLVGKATFLFERASFFFSLLARKSRVGQFCCSSGSIICFFCVLSVGVEREGLESRWSGSGFRWYCAVVIFF